MKQRYTLPAQVVVFSTIVVSIQAIALLLLLWLAKDFQ